MSIVYGREGGELEELELGEEGGQENKVLFCLCLERRRPLRV
jgi:hypothetical protein